MHKKKSPISIKIQFTKLNKQKNTKKKQKTVSGDNSNHNIEHEVHV